MDALEHMAENHVDDIEDIISKNNLIQETRPERNLIVAKVSL